MAQADYDGIPVEGSKGPNTYYIKKRRLQIRKRGNNVAKGRKPTKNQMIHWMAFNDPKFLWRQFGDKDKPSFEFKRPNETDYNAFQRLSAPLAKVFLTKEESEHGAVVAYPAQMALGSLVPPIQYDKVGQRFRSDIYVADLQMNDQTTVAEFSLAVVAKNPKFQLGDTIGAWSVRQNPAGTTKFPSVTVTVSRLVLDKDNLAPLYTQVNREGFTPDEGYLSFTLTPDTLYCWTWNRDNRGDSFEYRCSDQSLKGDNTQLPGFQTEEAFERAAASYGGYKNQYLAPYKKGAFTFAQAGSGSTGNGTGNTDPTNPGGGSTGSGNSGSNGGSQGGGNNGGGASSGKVRVTVTGNMTGGVEFLGGGEYTPGEQVEIQAKLLPSSGLTFERWTDGNTRNPRTITVPDHDTTYTAELVFEMSR